MLLVGSVVLETCRFVGVTFEESSELSAEKPSSEDDVDDVKSSLLGLSGDNVAEKDDA